MRKLSFRICAFVVTVLSCFLVNFSMTVFADTTKQVETSSASSPSFEMTVDVNDRYTGGINYDDGPMQNFSGKALYIGVICALLLLGIVIIAVRARRFDDGDE